MMDKSLQDKYIQNQFLWDDEHNRQLKFLAFLNSKESLLLTPLKVLRPLPN